MTTKKKRTLTLQEVIARASKRGYKIEATITNENGWVRVRIHSITTPKGKKTKYSGSKGNTALRALMGQRESKKATESRRKSARAQKGKPRSKGLPKLSQAELNAIKRINRFFKKKGKTERVGIANVRKRKRAGGAEAVRQALNNTIEHYAGYAYPKTILSFAEKFMTIGLSKTTQLLISLIDTTTYPPTYNSDKRLLESALQKLPPSSEWEIIIWEYRSTYNCSELEAIYRLDNDCYKIVLSGIVNKNAIKKL